MKTTTPVAEPTVSDTTPYVPSGRPVPKFVAALVALLLLGGGIFASGLFRNPINHNGSGGSTFNEVTLRATSFVELKNMGLFGVTIVGVSGEAITDVTALREVGVSDDLDTLPDGFERVFLSSGEKSRVAFSYTVDCTGVSEGMEPPLRMTVENVLGSRRTFSLDSDSLHWCTIVAD